MPLAGHEGVSTILIGPEGGFTTDEVPVSVPRAGLGQRVLRVETVAIVGATLLRSGSGRLGRSTLGTVED